MVIAPPGKGETSEPVAMTMFLASISVGWPSVADSRGVMASLVGDEGGRAFDVVDFVLPEEQLNAFRQACYGLILRLQHFGEV